MSIYRNTVWFLKGMSEYTKNGYVKASAGFNSADMEVDCSGLVYMITGSNSGLGYQTAKEIAAKGGTIHMVCRNPTTAEDARKQLVEETKSENIHLHILDISQPKSIVEFTKKFTENHEKLDVLINNAGCMVNSRQETEEGVEKNFATNTLGTFILTKSLIPFMEKSAKTPSPEFGTNGFDFTACPRIITVSSGGMLTNKLNVKDFQFTEMKPFDGTMAYAQNKRQQVIMTKELALKHPAIFFSSMHPGWADTPAVRSAMPDFYEKMKDKLRTTEQGADSIVWLAVSKAPLTNNKSGKFFQDRQAVNTHLLLAWSKESSAERDILMETLENFKKQFEC